MLESVRRIRRQGEKNRVSISSSPSVPLCNGSRIVSVRKRFRFTERRIHWPGAAVLLFHVLACDSPRSAVPEYPDLPPRHRKGPTVIVIGIDGAEWKVIRRLWDEGRLPNLRRLAEEGTAGDLGTDYAASPVIWSTIATGRTPEVHGITDFAVTTDGGTVPVSSSLRRVPALWNMASRAGLRTAVLGWWASWPAEEVAGVVVSDRAHLPVDRIVHPPGYLERFLAERDLAGTSYPGLSGIPSRKDIWMADSATRDRIMAHEARRLVPLGFDLFLVYFRSVDVASHRYWRVFEPERYPSVTKEEIDASGGVIPAVYEATDRAIGDILAKAPPDANVFVISDHGFFAGPEEHFVNLSSERLLEHLGFLVRKGEEVDFAHSVAYPVDSPLHARTKKFRISVEGREPGGRMAPGEVAGAIRDLSRALRRVTYANGTPVFRVRRPAGGMAADLVAQVNVEDPTLEILVSGTAYRDVVLYIDRISGTHDKRHHGIFIARGPDLVPGAAVEGITILDVAPTLLYALGLPIGEDFPGKARQELFRDPFRELHPLRTVPTWGTMETWGVESSPVDSRILDELRALGYIES
jgi:predicted AlkP superfamily phosphohydrolase/phosphomutase